MHIYIFISYASSRQSQELFVSFVFWVGTEKIRNRTEPNRHPVGFNPARTRPGKTRTETEPNRLIPRRTYVCSRFVERRLWWNVKLDETSHQTWERLIKLDESDSLNLMNENVISSNLTKAIHQTWWRHLIKSNERVISSIFWKERQFLYFLMSNLLQWHLM